MKRSIVQRIAILAALAMFVGCEAGAKPPTNTASPNAATQQLKTFATDNAESAAAIQANTLDLGDESTNPSTLPAAIWPASCHGDLVIDTADTSTLVCDYVDPPLEDLVGALPPDGTT